MASVVAMASLIEDFDTQPCKKTRKDGGTPVVKTITNYFSPVAKPAEKPFSPPRSNNIMDYFTRKHSSSNEKSSPSEQSKENCLTTTSAEKLSSTEAAGRPKRSRKTIKAARKLVEPEAAASQTEEESFLILDGPHRDSVTEVTDSCGGQGRETAAVFPQLCGEESKTVTVIDQLENNKQDNVSKSSHSEKPREEVKSVKSSSEVVVRDKTKRVKTASRNLKKRHQVEVKPPEPEMKGAESPGCDDNTEGEMDQTSELNKSTVTISFEDFLQSQSLDQHEEQRKDQEQTTADAASQVGDQLKNVDSGEPVFQVSPRTLTIQAEVHTVSPKQEANRTVGRMASIFSNRKKAAGHTEEVSSTQMEPRHQSPPNNVTVKRKSNVVLQEEDLELAVLESENTPKSSEADRKQFMAAFKRSSIEGSKTKSGKNQSKQKLPRENNHVDQAESAAENKAATPPTDETVPAEPQENKQQVDRKKLSTKGRRKAKNEVQTATTVSGPGPAAEAPPSAEDTAATNIDSDVKKEEPTTPSLRRSKREAHVRQAPDVTAAGAVRKNRAQRESKDEQKTPKKRSTPKKPRRKHGVFVAEIVGPPDAKESPIRMKFIRVQRNVSKADADRGRGGQSSTAPDKENKKIKKAKQLVEKAKVMQQSKRAATAEEKSAPRRSSRREATSRKSYCENEDSVICLEDSPPASSPSAAPEKSKTQKSLRSLNDVLGKTTSALKSDPGSKEKTARKMSAVISIFDDSSREGSENSQDDEQFRARREFLKSGLPESFRKQIAKAAATKESYSLSCSSFTPVTHIRQQPNDCPLSTLPWPSSLLLSPLKEVWGQSCVSHTHVGGTLCMKTEPAQRTVCKKLSGWRPQISESIRQLLLEEIRASNPSFPTQMFISRFLKRRADQQQHCTPSETTSLHTITGKRKRMDDEEETTVKLPKKQRGSRSGETVSKPEPEGTNRGRLRRTKSSKPEEEKDKSLTNSSKDDCVIVLDDLPSVQDAVEKDVVKEDVLWTEKYQPQHSSDITGNTPSVKRLHSWLKEWKLRADREERKKQKDTKQEEESNDSDWELGEGSMDAEDMLCNTMLITGPTGVGKTAAVYACAQELGFKVFEVNASSQRSGRLILSQLREATQSHQVDSQGVNAHKPTYFNSYGASSSSSIRLGSSPRKVNSPRRVVSSPRKLPQSPRGAKRGSLAPTSLASFFKMGRPTNKEPQNAKKNEQTAGSKKTKNDVERLKSPTQKLTFSPKEKSEEQSRKTATSLILFEEVDVIFEEDSGFLAAIKTFMTTTKRPVILTTSDPAFGSMFDGNFEEIHFKTPVLPNVSSYLQLLCLAEDVRTDVFDINSLLRLNGCDIRQSLLQLQFYTRTAGGRHVAKPFNHLDNNAEVRAQLDGEAKEDCVVAPPPLCDTGCTESMLGLRNIQPGEDIWELLKSQSLKEDVCWELLVDSRRRGADLLYTNLERLLPLPHTTLTHRTSSLPKPDQAAESGDCSDNGSPVKISQTTKNSKKKKCLDRNRLNFDSDSEDDFMTLPKPPVTPQDQEVVNDGLISETVKRKVLTPEERLRSLPVGQCLDSIADFFDNMSYLDSSVLAYPDGGAVDRRMAAAGAVLKDGMTDEWRFETNGESWTRGGQVLEIQAAVEALSFRKCRDSVAKAWGTVQELDGEVRKEATEEVTLPVASHRDGYSFSQDGPCPPQLVQRRREMMESLLLRGVVSLGNRAAAAVEYLPVLRDICRTEQLKEKGKIKRRFLHYLDAVHLGLTKNTLQHLAEDFP